MTEIVLQSQGDDGSKDPVDEGQETDLKGGSGEGTDEEIAAAAAAKKVEDDAAAAAKPPTAEELLAISTSENQELRTLLRDGKRDMAALTERMNVSDAALEKAGLISEEDKQAAADQQAELTVRKAELETMLEVTRLNPKFEDVDTVVSQTNFDYTIELMASNYAAKHGTSADAAVEAVEGWVWAMTNPYRFMYDQIKKIHPSYTGKEGGAGKLPPESPGSIQDVHGGAGDADLSGWTTAKIDALPEDELQSVPRDVYTKYLRNELK